MSFVKTEWDDRGDGGGGQRVATFGDHDDRGAPGQRGGRRGGGGGRRGWRGPGYRGGRGRFDSRRPAMDALDEDGDATMGERSGMSSGRRSWDAQDDEKGSVFHRLGPQGESSRGDSRGRGGRRGRTSTWQSRGGGGGGGQRPGGRGASWHKVTIPIGDRQSKDSVLRQLQSVTREPFNPVRVHVLGEKLMFFLEDHQAAAKLKQLRELDTREGPLPVNVKPCPPPRGAGGDSLEGGGRGWGDTEEGGRWSRGGGGGGGQGQSRFNSRGGGRGGSSSRRLDGDIMMEEDATPVLMQVLGERYDPSEQFLDLSDMFNDPTLKAHNIRAIMHNRTFVSNVLNLIREHCPDLKALNLSSNRLQHLEVYADLPTKCPHLQSLSLSDNQLRSISELKSIAGFSSLTSLSLLNNSIADNDFATYAASVRKLFPSLQSLDGQQLHSPVKFDLPASTGQLPPVEKGYLVNEEVKSILVTFLEQYYNMYDGDSREKLLEAYSSDASFSMSVSAPRSSNRQGPRADVSKSRNLLMTKDLAKRKTMLKHGRIDIVQFLRGLPVTKHHPGSFYVDVLKATPASTAFVVYGLLSELTGSNPDEYPVRAFTRTFILAAAGSGVVIINDQLTLRNANERGTQFGKEEMRKVFSQQQQLAVQHLQVTGVYPQTSPVASPPSTYPGPSFQTTPPSFANPQEDAVTRLSQETRMKPDWSRRCLTENQWDYSKAVAAFQVLQGQGKIPQEAFV